jgi:acyl carrier protein
MREKVVAIIETAVRDSRDFSSDAVKVTINQETRLYGKQGILDSIGLVTMIADVEQQIEDELGHQITLADEKALSQARSPFRTIGSLADYACSLIEQDAV